MRTRPLATSLLVGLVVAMPTSAAAISGGEEANSEYIVQIATQTNKESTQTGTESKKIDRCTGSALNSEWIITANHCIEDAASQTSANIYFSNDKKKPGDPIASAEIVPGPSADLALIKLSKPHELSQYATLASDHEVTEGQEGYIYGYGRGSKGEAVSWLRRATVTQRDEGRDAYWNKTYGLEGKDGISNHGDSGGPFIVNNKLVGITVSGPHVANDYWIGKFSNAVLLAPFVEWITKTTGVKAVPFATEIPATPAPEKKPEDVQPGDAPSTQPDDTPTTQSGDTPTTKPGTEMTPAPADTPSAAPSTDPSQAAPSDASSAAKKAPADSAATNGTPSVTPSEPAPAGTPAASSTAVGTPDVAVPAAKANGAAKAGAKGGRKAELANTGSSAAALALVGVSLAAGGLLIRRGSASRREA
ncbi:S1 family peptidase [Trueperella pyogenes]|uniref:S1 family peptidase n=1 Tax=Trueperella pyogenes TaxID=1661 RepID=UPI0023DDC0C2|nr:trypsin-like serine protease [Trueperella pyogenes]